MTDMARLRTMLFPGMIPRGPIPRRICPSDSRNNPFQELSLPTKQNRANRSPLPGTARERVSSGASPGLRASLTLEAVFSLTIFLFAVLPLLGLFPALAVGLRIQHALDQTAEEAAMALYSERTLQTVTGIDAGEDGLLSAAGGGASLAAVSVRVVSLAGGSGLNSSCVEGGSMGISLLGSKVPDASDRVHLTALYRIRLPSVLPGLFLIPVRQESVRRAWTGTSRASGEDKDRELVYVTEHGRVYHTTTSCTYLDLSVHLVPAGSAAGMRNASGQRYKPCERCARYAEPSGAAIITDYGTRYHLDRKCGGLRRTVRAVERGETSLPPCSRCGQSHASEEENAA